jgi:hypothetical protein
MLRHDDLPALCDEFKRVCYERGAEDNLTAVIVSVGTPIFARDRNTDLQKTISPEASATAAVAAAETEVGAETVENFLPPSRTAFPAGPASAAMIPEPAIENRLNVAAAPPSRSGIERTMTRLFLLVLFFGVVAAAFYAGRKYKGQIPYVDQSSAPVAEASPTPVVGDDPMLKFERARREVDNDPNTWLNTQLKSELTRQSISQPLDSTEAEFLYLYGRASLLAGNNEEATKAFDAAITRANLSSPQANATLKKEAALGLAAVALKSDKDRASVQARFDEIMRPAPSPASSSPSSSPSLSPSLSP